MVLALDLTFQGVAAVIRSCAESQPLTRPAARSLHRCGRSGRIPGMPPLRRASAPAGTNPRVFYRSRLSRARRRRSFERRSQSFEHRELLRELLLVQETALVDIRRVEVIEGGG